MKTLLLISKEPINSGFNLLSIGVLIICIDFSFNNLLTSIARLTSDPEAKIVASVPGVVFGAPGYMRLSYALSDDELSEGLERLNKAVEELNG